MASIQLYLLQHIINPSGAGKWFYFPQGHLRQNFCLCTIRGCRFMFLLVGDHTPYTFSLCDGRLDEFIRPHKCYLCLTKKNTWTAYITNQTKTNIIFTSVVANSSLTDIPDDFGVKMQFIIVQNCAFGFCVRLLSCNAKYKDRIVCIIKVPFKATLTKK